MAIVQDGWWDRQKKKAPHENEMPCCDSERIRTFIVRTGILNSIH